MKDLKISTWIFCQKGKMLFDSHKPKLFEIALQERECKSYQDYYSSSKPHEKVLRKSYNLSTWQRFAIGLIAAIVILGSGAIIWLMLS